MSEAKQTAKLALEALEDKKAMDVRILDITHVSTLADYFMIASGSNRNQVQAMADNVEGGTRKSRRTSKTDRRLSDRKLDSDGLRRCCHPHL